MDTSEALDQEVIIERAELLREWLAGLSLSSEVTSALERELTGIIANDPGGYINGQRPLAGLTVEDFVAELHSASAGVVGRVRGFGDGLIGELREAVPLDGLASDVPANAAPDAPEAVEPSAPARRARAKRAAPDAAETPGKPAAARRGRPKSATPPNAPSVAVADASQDGAVAVQEPVEAPNAPAPARRGRPKRAAPAEQPAETPTLAASEPDAEAPNQPAPARRGRPKRAAPAEPSTEEASTAVSEVQEEAQPPSVAASAASDEAEQLEEPVDKPAPARRGRPKRVAPAEPSSVAAATEQAEAPSEPAPARRGRPKRVVPAAAPSVEELAQATLQTELPVLKAGEPEQNERGQLENLEPQAGEPESGELAQVEAATPAPDEAPASAPAPSRRGRVGRPPSTSAAPSLVKPPVADGVASVAFSKPAVLAAPKAETDPALGQLARLWPSLHPQARRAILLYASELLAEAAYQA